MFAYTWDMVVSIELPAFPGVPNQVLVPFGLFYYISLNLQHNLSVTESTWQGVVSGCRSVHGTGEAEQRKGRGAGTASPPCPYQEGQTSALETLQETAKAGVYKRHGSGLQRYKDVGTVVHHGCSKPVAHTCPSRGSRCTRLHY